MDKKQSEIVNEQLTSVKADNPENRKKLLCEVCSTNVSKYKCPICLTRYCSVTCYKGHKDSDNCVRKVEAPKQQVPPPQSLAETKYEFETEDTVAVELLKRLGKDKTISNALQNRHLRDMIMYLDASNNPSYDIAHAMREPVFVEFASRCLRIVDSSQSDGFHTFDSSDSDND